MITKPINCHWKAKGHHPKSFCYANESRKLLWPLPERKSVQSPSVGRKSPRRNESFVWRFKSHDFPEEKNRRVNPLTRKPVWHEMWTCIFEMAVGRCPLVGPKKLQNWNNFELQDCPSNHRQEANIWPHKRNKGGLYIVSTSVSMLIWEWNLRIVLHQPSRFWYFLPVLRLK